MTTVSCDGGFPFGDFYDEPFMPFTWQILQLLFPKLLFFSCQKMDEFNFKPAQYCI